MASRTACYHLLSRMLTYPDERLRDTLPSLADVLAQGPDDRLATGLRKGIAQMASQAPRRLQETYTAAFDLDPAGTLNLTYHLWGDGEKRSAALVRLHQLYRDAGWETTTTELPDYLPLMLEFMAVCPDAHSHAPVQTCLGCLQALAARVRPTAPLYADLLDLLDEEIRRNGGTAAVQDGGEPRCSAAGGPTRAQRSPSWS